MKKSIAIILPALITLLLLETALRLVGYAPLRSWPSSEGYFWICDETLGWRNRANGTHVLETIAVQPLSTTDKNGFRNGLGWQDDSDKPIVLIAGDSVVFCSEVNDDATIASRLAGILKEKCDVKVLNTGVRGYNSVQSLRMIEECLRRFPKTLVVVYVYCPNDFFENVIPDVYSPARAPTAYVDKAGGTLNFIEPSPLPVPAGEELVFEKKRNFDVLLRMHSATANCISLMWPKFRIFSKKQKDSGPLKEWATKMNAPEILQRVVLRMDAACRRQGAGFLTAPYALAAPDELALYSEVCRKTGVTFVDSAAKFTDEPTSYLSLRKNGNYDSHFGPKGTQAFAEALAPAVLGKIPAEFRKE